MCVYMGTHMCVSPYMCVCVCIFIREKAHVCVVGGELMHVVGGMPMHACVWESMHVCELMCMCVCI